METEAGRRWGAVSPRPLIRALGRITTALRPAAGTGWRIAAVPRPPIAALWAAIALVVLLYATHQVVGLGGRGSDEVFNNWVNAGLLWTAALACLAGALRQVRGRTAWLLFALALASWAIGDTIWSIRFGHGGRAPLVSISDGFWLAWYPLVVTALFLLVRDRVPGFDLNRWIDGVAVMLMVATAWVALFLQPALQRSHASTLARVLGFAYPLGDAVLFGATLGVFALMAWRPGRMWLVLGIALMVMGLIDALFSVNVTGSAHEQGLYGAAWGASAALVAFAAWEPHPGQLEPRRSTGWSAIALPVAAQVLAAAIQLYAFFHEIARSERILTVIVLAIATIQIVIRRPRPEPKLVRDRDAPDR